MSHAEDKNSPWFWSGWIEQLGVQNASRAEVGRPLRLEKDGRRYLFLQAQEIVEDVAQDLEWAEVVFVDFFPDEIHKGVWKIVRPWGAKFYFLPPQVALPPVLGQKRSKLLMLSNMQREGLPPLPPVVLSIDKSAPTYEPLPVPIGPFTRAFDSVEIKTLHDVVGALNAPGWVLVAPTPQVEHALYTVAQQYGIKFSFWERQYTSPLRYLVGYECPMGLCLDKTLRARFKRVVASNALPKSAHKPWTLQEVLGRLNFEQIGLLQPVVESLREGSDELLSTLLPEGFARQLAISTFQPALLVASENSFSDPTQVKAIWQLIIANVLITDNAESWHLKTGEAWRLNAPDAWRYWMSLLEKDQTATVEATVSLLDAAVGKPPILRRLLRIIFEVLIYYQVALQKVQKIIEFAEQSKKIWLVEGSTNYEWGIHYMLEALRDGKVTTLPKDCDANQDFEAYLYGGLARLYAGDIAEGERLIRKELDRRPLSRWGYWLALHVTLRMGAEVFKEVLIGAQKIFGEADVAFIAVRQLKGFAGDRDWCGARQGLLKFLTAIIKGCKWQNAVTLAEVYTLEAMSGDWQEAWHGYQANQSQMIGKAATTVAFAFLNAGQVQIARDILEKINLDSASMVDRIQYGAVAFAAGLDDLGTVVLEQVREKYERFWRSTVLDWDFDLKSLYAGMIGQAVGDEAIVTRAMERLSASMWADKQAQLKSIKRISAPAALKEELRSWILAGL